MTDHDIASALGEFPLGALCNAHPDVRALGCAVAPLFEGARLSGPAKTAKISPGQNAAVHRAVHSANAGDVLVVAADGDTSNGSFGDIMATCCRNRKIRGLVIDGAVRDADEIARLGFPVFCLGANPTATRKTDPGEIDVEIVCGGARVLPGDFVVGGADGVVIIPRAIAADVICLADAVMEKEKAIMARLAEGRTTCEIFGIDPANPANTETQR